MPQPTKYRYVLSFLGHERVCYPLQSGQSLKYELFESNPFVWREKLGKEVPFGSLLPQHQADFQWLYSFENSSDRCEEIKFRIERLQPDG